MRSDMSKKTQELNKREKAILKFIEKFENDDDSWIDEINEKL